MGYFSDLDMENKEKPDESFAEAMYNRGKELEELEGKIFVHDWQPCRMHYRAILEKYKILKEVKTNQCLAILSKK